MSTLNRYDLLKKKHVAEQPVLNLGGPGEFDEFGTYPLSVIWNGADVRAYYAGWTRCVSVPFNVAIGCATSTDGGRTRGQCLVIVECRRELGTADSQLHR
jgi:hypothetical protein